MAKTVSNKPRWLKIDGEKFYLNSEKTAEFFDVSPRTLLNWEEQGAPKESTGWWDLKAVLEWREARGEGNQDSARKLKAEADRLEEQVYKLRLENEIKLSNYMPKADLEEEWSRRVTEVNLGLRIVPKKLAGEISDPDIAIVIEQRATELIYEILEQYARDGAYTPKPKSKKRNKAK